MSPAKPIRIFREMEEVTERRELFFIKFGAAGIL